MEQFSALLAHCAWNSPVPVNSPHKGQWRGALMLPLICAWINDWVKKTWSWWFETPPWSLWRHCDDFADDIFESIFYNENIWISIKISLKFVPKGPIDNKPSLIHIKAWCRTSGKPLSALQWRHNEHDSVSNHQPHDCFLNRLFRRRSKKTSKLRVAGLCAENSPGTGEFPAQKASNAENISIWWRHHGTNYGLVYWRIYTSLGIGELKDIWGPLWYAIRRDLCSWLSDSSDMWQTSRQHNANFKFQSDTLIQTTSLGGFKTSRDLKYDTAFYRVVIGLRPI